MLLHLVSQRTGRGTSSPLRFSPPLWSVLAKSWDQAHQSRGATVTLGPTVVSLVNDGDQVDDLCIQAPMLCPTDCHVKPSRGSVCIEKFVIEWRPVTNHEFHQFYVTKGRDTIQLPTSWIEIEGDIQVCTRSLLSSGHETHSHASGAYVVWPSVYGNRRELADDNFLPQSLRVCWNERRSYPN